MGDHTESTEIDFDPTVISYADLLDMFWKSHTPTRTQSSVQYRCVVFCHDDKQKKLAMDSKDKEAAKRNHSISTAVESMSNTKFTLAEDYHQKFYLRGNRSFFRFFDGMPLQKFIDSRAAAKINGYIEGIGSYNDLKKDSVFWTDLDKSAVSQILSICEKDGSAKVADEEGFFCARK